MWIYASVTKVFVRIRKTQSTREVMMQTGTYRGHNSPGA